MFFFLQYLQSISQSLAISHMKWKYPSAGMAEIMKKSSQLLIFLFFLLQKGLCFEQVAVKLLVTLIYSFVLSKLDIRMSAGHRNIYSTESSGCIAIEENLGYCVFTV